MLFYRTRTEIAHISLGHVVSCLILYGVALLLAAEAFADSDTWSQVRKLKSNTRIYVFDSGRGRMEGRFVSADASRLTVRVIPQEEITLARDMVLQVAIDQGKRHWYSIPLAVVAGAAGGYGGYLLASKLPCKEKIGGEKKACNSVGSLIVVGSATIAAAGPLVLTTHESTKKVIYTK